MCDVTLLLGGLSTTFSDQTMISLPQALKTKITVVNLYFFISWNYGKSFAGVFWKGMSQMKNGEAYGKCNV